jgi:hypothetical protein
MVAVAQRLLEQQALRMPVEEALAKLAQAVRERAALPLERAGGARVASVAALEPQECPTAMSMRVPTTRGRVHPTRVMPATRVATNERLAPREICQPRRPRSRN